MLGIVQNRLQRGNCLYQDNVIRKECYDLVINCRLLSNDGVEFFFQPDSFSLSVKFCTVQDFFKHNAS